MQTGRQDGYDVVVVGAGIVGLACAWMATRRGLSVAVVEKDHRCIGASIRNFGFVTVTGQRAGKTWRRAMRSRDLWAELAPQANIAVLHQGLWVLAQRPAAWTVLEAFAKTDMGEQCQLCDAQQTANRAPFLRTQGAQGALYSPHELRVESREAIGQLAQWLAEEHQVDFFFGHEAVGLLPNGLEMSSARGQIRLAAERVVLAPGTRLTGLAKPYLADLSLGLTQLQMLRVRPLSPYQQSSAVMSDLSLVRYAGYTGLAEHRGLLAQLQVECPDSLADGIHLIVVQSADGSLVVGDSHHPEESVDPFGREVVDRRILRHMLEAIALDGYEVVDRWLGWYPVGGPEDALVLSPEPGLRVVSVTSGTGASTAFGLAEEVFDQWSN
ncbi:MAG: hypothetical protein RL446_687 [Pseudomonadota bacterium]